ncbi:MAG: hypothetical protein RH862_10735 [Leptospiraceae bacterium]
MTDILAPALEPANYCGWSGIRVIAARIGVVLFSVANAYSLFSFLAGLKKRFGYKKLA